MPPASSEREREVADGECADVRIRDGRWLGVGAADRRGVVLERSPAIGLRRRTRPPTLLCRRVRPLRTNPPVHAVLKVDLSDIAGDEAEHEHRLDRLRGDDDLLDGGERRVAAFDQWREQRPSVAFGVVHPSVVAAATRTPTVALNGRPRHGRTPRSPLGRSSVREKSTTPSVNSLLSHRGKACSWLTGVPPERRRSGPPTLEGVEGAEQAVRRVASEAMPVAVVASCGARIGVAGGVLNVAK